MDGGVTVFDNGPPSAESRAVRLALDPEAGTAREVAAWSVGEHCDIQGGASLVGDSMLATCATTSTVQEFAADASVAHFSLTASCGSAGPGAPPWSRAMPVDL